MWGMIFHFPRKQQSRLFLAVGDFRGVGSSETGISNQSFTT
jgi:hypothetical protein